MLEPEQIEQIDKTREILRSRENETLGEPTYPYGRFGEACRAADEALFQVLLISRHWFTSEISDS